jgi:hypothetical protein
MVMGVLERIASPSVWSMAEVLPDEAGASSSSLVTWMSSSSRATVPSF